MEEQLLSAVKLEVYLPADPVKLASDQIDSLKKVGCPSSFLTQEMLFKSRNHGSTQPHISTLVCQVSGCPAHPRHQDSDHRMAYDRHGEERQHARGSRSLPTWSSTSQKALARRRPLSPSGTCLPLNFSPRPGLCYPPSHLFTYSTSICTFHVCKTL
jgi:hypothetical protein